MASKQAVLVMVLLAGTFSGAAFGQAACTCDNNQQQVTNQNASNTRLTDALTSLRVCVGSSPTFEAQEEHRAGGELWDYKRGGGTVDPTSRVGSWAINNTGAATTVTHTYGATAYTWKVCSTKTNGALVAGDVIGFCPSGSNTPSVSATLRALANPGC